MRILRIHSEVDPTIIQKQLDGFEALALGPKTIEALEEVKLAEYLAKKAFKNRKNIANKFKYEFLLWLSGKRDIKSAMEETKPRGKKFLVVILSGNENEILKKLNAKKIGLKIRKNADSLRLEKISLSRLK